MRNLDHRRWIGLSMIVAILAVAGIMAFQPSGVVSDSNGQTEPSTETPTVDAIVTKTAIPTVTATVEVTATAVPSVTVTAPPTFTPPPSPTPKVTPKPPSSKGKWIEIILSQQRLNAWENGKIVMTSLISSGTRAHPTRRGTFKIYKKYRATRMRGPGYNLPGVPYTMYYSGSYAVHGAYWHHNFGHPMSHGCVNLPVAFAGRLYAWAPVGTRVVIH